MADKTVFVVDDDDSVRGSLRALLESVGYQVIDYESALDFLGADESRGSCLLADIRMPKMSGLELQDELVRRGSKLPVIIMTGHGDVPLAVRAMKAGAVDFIEKPFHEDTMLASIEKAMAVGRRERASRGGFRCQRADRPAHAARSRGAGTARRGPLEQTRGVRARHFSAHGGNSSGADHGQAACAESVRSRSHRNRSLDARSTDLARQAKLNSGATLTSV